MLTYMSQRESDDYLQARYGNSQKSSRRWLIPATIFLIVGGGWLIWSADHYSKPEIRSDLISFSITSPKSVSLRYAVNVRTADKSHQCILTATDYQANIVGQITDTIPAGANNYTRLVSIPTRTPAVSASIEHCS